MVIINK